MNEKEHIYDDCIGNPPFAEAMKTLGGGMNTEWKLTEAQQRFFDEKKERVSNLPEDATEREKEFAKIALFMANYAENLQGALNRLKIERTAAVERGAIQAPHGLLEGVGRDGSLLPGYRPPLRQRNPRPARKERPHPEGRADASPHGADAEAHEVELAAPFVYA